MKELLAKIREAKVEQKCQLVAEAYAVVQEGVADLESQAEAAGLDLNVDIFETDLDEMEEVLEELSKLLNPELQIVLKFLQPRFEKNMHRHKSFTWEQVERRLREADQKKLWSLNEMEKNGGEPDVVGVDKKNGELVFQDRSAESPTGRRNCVYDREAEQRLKILDPNDMCSGNAIDLAAAMGVGLLDEQEYRAAQAVDGLDKDSLSWVKPSIDTREKGCTLDGKSSGGDVYVFEGNPRNHSVIRGFPASLRV